MSSRVRSLVLTAALVAPAAALVGESTPTPEQIRATMKRATRFMVEEVSTEGGYVWNYLPDRSRRWGELEARPMQIWIQPPGTATMGHLFLDAYHATEDEYYYRAAESVGAALVRAQHPSGGWNYLFDFAGDQYFSAIRGQRLLVRGERGEIVNHGAVYLQDRRTPVSVEFIRHSAGPNGNLEGNYLKGIQAGEGWVYHNPLAPGELSDDEIAVGTCLLRMAESVAGGAPCYPLAEACQDRYLDILLGEAVATGQPITSQTQPWSG